MDNSIPTQPPVVPQTQAMGMPVSTQVPDVAGLPPQPTLPVQPSGVEPPKKGSGVLMILIVVTILLLICGGAYYMLVMKKAPEPVVNTEPVKQTTLAPENLENDLSAVDVTDTSNSDFTDVDSDLQSL